MHCPITCSLSTTISWSDDPKTGYKRRIRDGEITLAVSGWVSGHQPRSAAPRRSNSPVHLLEWDRVEENCILGGQAFDRLQAITLTSFLPT